MPRSGHAPVIREIDLPDPLVALSALRGLPHAFMLHSGQAEPRGRWSFFGADPFAVYGPDRYDEAIARWRDARSRIGVAADPEAPPFLGGLVGAWSYDFGRRLERIPDLARDDRGWPDAWLAAYDVIGAVDHATGRAWLVATPGWDREDAEGRLDDWRRRLERERRAGSPGLDDRRPRRPATGPVPIARSTFAPDGYRAAVERIRDHIRRGDLFQANLSQRWTVESAGDSASLGIPLFRTLSRVSPAPFGAYLDLGDRTIASASPERFLEVRGSRVETRPIKGTRPRGSSVEADARERTALLESAKDRAENVMIVDVLRNDLGRVCEIGSVETPELCVLETFAQVHHLTSTVTGRLRADRDAVDLLHACFPGGSITGAPKIRAMEILEGLEPVRRGPYTGAIGWLDWRGDADWNIAIRTALLSPGHIDFAAGGGITADSDPEAERLETLAKAAGWRAAMAACGLPVRLEGAPEDGLDPWAAAPAAHDGDLSSTAPSARRPIAVGEGRH